MVLGPRARQLLPYINFFVATTALGFQTTVLYPWHYQLDEAFHKLKDEQARMLRMYHEVKIQRFEELERRMEGLEKRMQVCRVNASMRVAMLIPRSKTFDKAAGRRPWPWPFSASRS
ncbi:hypothetical protein B0H11DRAFT_2063654 [Mycena galericulata]|nr:hypothetical protein B0H11DRAFT_2063654 [Mycena galericulata]